MSIGPCSASGAVCKCPRCYLPQTPRLMHIASLTGEDVTQQARLRKKKTHYIGYNQMPKPRTIATLPNSCVQSGLKSLVQHQFQHPQFLFLHSSRSTILSAKFTTCFRTCRFNSFNHGCHNFSNSVDIAIPVSHHF